MSTKRTWLIVLGAVALLVAVGMVLHSADIAHALSTARASSMASVTIPYTGRLADAAGQPVTDGTYDFTFALYDAEADGTLLWAETQPGVKVTGGTFVAPLGSAIPIPVAALEGGKRWLAVGVRGTGEVEFTALTPRQELNAGSSVSPAAPLAAAACPHDHLGEVWNANIGWANAGLKINNSNNGPSFWGTSTGGGNGVRGDSTGFTTSIGVYGGSDAGAGVVGRSSSGNGVEGHSTSGSAGVLGEGGNFAVLGQAASGGWGVYSIGDMRTTGYLSVFGAMDVWGLATFHGGKSGYVVDVAQNDDTVSLALGDVVITSGAAPAVLGEIPVIKVRRATDAEMNGVVGVVDQHLIVPPKQSTPNSTEKDQSTTEYAPATPGMYVTVVTLGSFKAIKADASTSAISPGDLLVASSNPGYAMKATSPKPGTIIGKALGTLTSGTGVIPVIITLQ